MQGAGVRRDEDPGAYEEREQVVEGACLRSRDRRPPGDPKDFVDEIPFVPIGPRHEPDGIPSRREFPDHLRPGHRGIALVARPGAASRMDQNEAPGALTLRHTQSSGQARRREDRGMQYRKRRGGGFGRPRESLDEGCVAVVAGDPRTRQSDAMIHEEIREFPGSRAIEADATGGPGQSGQDAALQDAVEIECQIESTAAKSPDHAGETSQERKAVGGAGEFGQITPWEHEGLVDDLGRIHDAGGGRLDQPRQMRPRVERPDREGRRQCSHDVAQRAETNDQDPIGLGWTGEPIAERGQPAPVASGRRRDRSGSFGGGHVGEKTAKRNSCASPSASAVDRIRSMRIARTLSLYLMRETLLYCALVFFVLTFIVLAQNLLRRLDQLFLVGMTRQDLLRVVESIFPVALSYSIPLAFLLGILLSIRRLASDGELAGLASTGFGPTRFLLPYLVLGLGATGLSAWLLGSVEHQSRRELVQLFKTVAARGAILEPGKFREIGPRLVYVGDRGRDGDLSEVMIFDESQPERSFRIFADRGRFRFDEVAGEIRLELWNGDLHFTPSPRKPRRYERIQFDEFVYHLDVRHILGGEFGPVRPKQMTLEELHSVLARARAGDPLRELDQRNPLEYELEIQRRRALPLAPLIFAGFGVPIALTSAHRGRNLGFLLALGLGFGYYALGAAMESLAGRALLSAPAAVWIPDLVFAALGSGLVLAERKFTPA